MDYNKEEIHNMNIDELRALKVKLEEERKQRVDEQEFIPTFLDPQEFVTKEPARKLKEIKEQSNTEEVVNKCISLIERTMRVLTEKGIEFDQIQLSSATGIFVTPELYGKMYKYMNDCHNGVMDDEHNLIYFSILNNLKKQVSMEYVPVHFWVNEADTGLEDCSVGDYEYETGIYPEIPRDRVEGIINFPLFIAKMKELGIDVELMENGDCSSMDDYVLSVQEHGIDEFLCLNADFGRKQKMEEQQNKGIK